MSLTLKSPSKVVITMVCAGLVVTQISCKQPAAKVAKPAIEQQAANDFMVNHVDARGANALLQESDDFVVLDIRTPKEVKAGHIEGAVFADFYADDFADNLSKLDKETPYIIHCGSGGRSTKALTTMEALGFTNVTHMDGGLGDWKKADLPLTQPE